MKQVHPHSQIRAELGLCVASKASNASSVRSESGISHRNHPFQKPTLRQGKARKDNEATTNPLLRPQAHHAANTPNFHERHHNYESFDRLFFFLYYSGPLPSKLLWRKSRSLLAPHSEKCVCAKQKKFYVPKTNTTQPIVYLSGVHIHAS